MNRRIRKKRAKKLFREAAIQATSAASWRAVADRITKNHSTVGSREAAAECYSLAHRAKLESITTLAQALRLSTKR